MLKNQKSSNKLTTNDNNYKKINIISEDADTNEINELNDTIQINIKSAAGFTRNTNICLIDDHTYISLCGNIIKIQSSINHSQSFLISQNNLRITIFDFCHKTSQIAYSTVSKEPDISIYTYLEKKLIGNLAGGAKLEFYQIKFSRCGKRLLSIEKDCERQVVIWDVETLSKVATTFIENPSFQYYFSSFDSGNFNNFVIGGEGGLYFFTIHKGNDKMFTIFSVESSDNNENNIKEQPVIAKRVSYKQQNITVNNDIFKERLRNEKLDHLKKDKDNRTVETYIAHCWDTQNHVYVSTLSSKLFKFDGQTGLFLNVIPNVDTGSKISDIIVSMILTKEYLVCGAKDGNIFWLLLSQTPTETVRSSTKKTHQENETHNLDVSLFGTSIHLDVSQITQIPCRPVCCNELIQLFPSPSYKKAIVLVKESTVYEIRLDIDNNYSNNEDVDEKNYLVSNTHQNLNSVLNNSISLFSQCHVNGILCLSFLTAAENTSVHQNSSDFLLATAGISGELCIWSGTSMKLLQIYNINDLANSSDGKNNVVASCTNLINRKSFMKGNNSHTLPILTSLASRKNDPIISIGNERGELKIFCISRLVPDNFEMALLSNLLLSHHAIDLQMIHENRPILAAGSSQENIIYLVSLDPESKFSIVSYICLVPLDTLSIDTYSANENLNAADKIASFSWMSMDITSDASIPSLLILSNCFSKSNNHRTNIYFCEITNENSWNSPVLLTPHILNKNNNQKENLYLLQEGIMVSSSKKIVCTSDLSGFQVICFDDKRKDNQQTDITEKSTVFFEAVEYNPVDVITNIKQSILCIQKFPYILKNNSELFATGHINGMVSLWEITFTPNHIPDNTDTHSKSNKVERIISFYNHTEAVTKLDFLCINNETTLLFSCGLDGMVFSHVMAFDSNLAPSLETPSLLYSNIQALKLLHAIKYDIVNNNNNMNRLTFMEHLTNIKNDLENRENKKIKDMARIPINELRKKLKYLLEQNENDPDCYLEPSEFFINIQHKEEIIKNNRLKSEEVRMNIQRKIIESDIVARRIQAEFWDTGDVKGQILRGFLVNNSNGNNCDPRIVYNFPSRKLNEKADLVMKKILNMREIEIKHIQMTTKNSISYPELHETIPPNINWIVHAGLLHPLILLKKKSFIVKSTISPSQNDIPIPAANAEKTASNISFFDLLYHPCSMRTIKQKRIQFYLIINFMQLLYDEYNKDFQETIKLKELKMEDIETKNNRIKEICKELGLEYEISTLPPVPVTSIHQNSSTSTNNTNNTLSNLTSSPIIIFRPEFHPDEIADSVLKISKDEMTKTPYETEEMKNKRLKIEKEKNEEILKREKDNIGKRALNDMMKGTLEIKKDSIHNKKELEKPLWMNEISPDEYTVEQKLFAQEYEIKKKKANEEKEKYRKSLEIELKKLRNDIYDICRQFDEKLEYLQDYYLYTKISYLSQQLYALYLKKEFINYESLIIKKNKINEFITICNNKNSQMKNSLMQYQIQYDKSKNDLQFLQDEEKLLDKSFLREIENCTNNSLDQEMIRSLTDLYKQRKYGMISNDKRNSFMRSSSFRKKKMSLQRQGSKPNHINNSIASNSANPNAPEVNTRPGHAVHSKEDEFLSQENLNDPFNFLDELKKKNLENSNVLPLDPILDRPEGIHLHDPIWKKLNELRDKKISLELLVKKKNNEINDLLHIIDEVRKRENLYENKIKINNDILDECNNNILKIKLNSSILAQIKQGQNETISSLFNQMDINNDNNKFQMNYLNDAIMISRNQVDTLNDRIQVYGKEQVHILEKIKEFRKNINLIEWEHRYLNMKCSNLQDHYTDIQLLRVTKDLQNFFKTGDISEQQKQELNVNESKLTYITKNHQLNLIKLKKNVDNLNKQFLLKKQENDNFQKQLNQLINHVKIRQDICFHRTIKSKNDDTTEFVSSNHNNESSNKNNKSTQNNKMKAITIRRKLIDLAKLQTEEIEYLRQELDKLRRKTFPSFVQLSLSQQKLPDQI